MYKTFLQIQSHIAGKIQLAKLVVIWSLITGGFRSDVLLNYNKSSADTPVFSIPVI